MRSLNLDQLRTLQAVIETGGFTAAARQLHLSQSAVSTQIQELEQRLGVKLVERFGKRAFATEAGREVISYAQRIAGETDAIQTAMRRYKSGWIGRARIGTGLTALMYLLPPILKKLRTEHPGLELMVKNITTQAIIDGIGQNALDIGIVTLPIDGAHLEITPLIEEKMVAVLPAGTRGVPREITPSYAAEQSLILEPGAIHGLALGWLAAGGNAPRPGMVIGTVEAVKTLVAVGLGMSIVPEMAVAGRQTDLLVRPLSPPLTRTLAVVEHRNKPRDRALQIVRDAILELAN